jgi:hypothetical protein
MPAPDSYRADYDKGWRSTCDLDFADRKGYTRSRGWMDGRTDASMSLPKYHRRDCADTMGHDACFASGTIDAGHYHFGSDERFASSDCDDCR